MGKRDAFDAIIDSCEADVIAVTETWLNAHVCDNEIFTTSKSLNIYRRDRDGRQGGGTLLAISKRFKSFLTNVMSTLEVIWLVVNNKTLVLGICYRPPDTDISFVQEFHDNINEITMRYPSSSITILGNFNYPTIMVRLLVTMTPTLW